MEERRRIDVERAGNQLESKWSRGRSRRGSGAEGEQEQEKEKKEKKKEKEKEKEKKKDNFLRIFCFQCGFPQTAKDPQGLEIPPARG